MSLQRVGILLEVARRLGIGSAAPPPTESHFEVFSQWWEFPWSLDQEQLIPNQSQNAYCRARLSAEHPT
jgi:hypothetical protein